MLWIIPLKLEIFEIHLSLLSKKIMNTYKKRP